MKRILFSAVSLGAIFILASAPAVAERDTDYRNIKAVGMGDTRVAGGMEYNGFIDNPALLSRVKNFRLSIMNLPLTINKDLSDMAEFIKDNREKFEKFDELTPLEKEQFIKDVEPYDGQWGRVNVSPMVDAAVSFMGHSFGLSVFSVDDVSFKIDRGIYEPRVWGEGAADVGVVLGYSRPLSVLVPGLTVGANVKYIQRRTADLFQIKASDLADVTAQTVAEARQHTAAHPDIIATSSEKGMGIAELRAAVIGALE